MIRGEKVHNLLGSSLLTGILLTWCLITRTSEAQWMPSPFEGMGGNRIVDANVTLESTVAICPPSRRLLRGQALVAVSFHLITELYQVRVALRPLHQVGREP